MWGISPGPHSRWDGSIMGSRAIALGPIGHHELHSELIYHSHTGSIQPFPQDTRGAYSQPPTRHTGCIQSTSQDTRGAYSKAHKTHGVHTATPTGPQDHKTHIYFFMIILAQAMQYELAAANSSRGSILLLRDLRHGCTWVHAEQV